MRGVKGESCLFIPDGFEKGQSHQVIKMKMRDDDSDVFKSLIEKLLAKGNHARTHIKDNVALLGIRKGCTYTRGLSANFRAMLSPTRIASPNSPEINLHVMTPLLSFRILIIIFKQLSISLLKIKQKCWIILL